MTVDRQAGETVVIGTRGSALALAQAQRVASLLEAAWPGLRAELRVIRTEGDIDKASPLTAIGGRGVFTAGVQAALLSGEVDIAVHSAKDLPAIEPETLVLAAFPEREDPRDVVVSRHGVGLADLPPTPRIGTSSRRRAMQVSLLRPDACTVELRGNIDTRLRKSESADYDAIVLAAAGLTRMGWADRAVEWLPLDTFVPAPGQGALGVEARAGDAATLALLAAIDDAEVAFAVRAERAFLRALGAGCTTPLGSHVRRIEGEWRLDAVYGGIANGPHRILRTLGPDAEADAADAARDLLRLAGKSKVPARRRVLVTRPTAQAGPLVAALKAAGTEPVAFPTIRIVPAADPAPLADALGRAVGGAFEWIAFTSANAVEHVAASLRDGGLDVAALAGVRIAVVGKATAAALAGAGREADLVAQEATAEGLVAAMTAAGVAGQRVLYPRSDLARDALVRGLAEAGAIVEEVEAYRTLPETEVDPEARRLAQHGDVDVVTFASPSSVRNLAAALGGDISSLGRARVVCVGPVTARVAAEVGLPPHAVATDASVDGLVAATTAALAGIGRGVVPGDAGDDSTRGERS